MAAILFCVLKEPWPVVAGSVGRSIADSVAQLLLLVPTLYHHQCQSLPIRLGDEVRVWEERWLYLFSETCFAATQFNILYAFLAKVGCRRRGQKGIEIEWGHCTTLYDISALTISPPARPTRLAAEDDDDEQYFAAFKQQ